MQTARHGTLPWQAGKGEYVAPCNHLHLCVSKHAPQQPADGVCLHAGRIAPMVADAQAATVTAATSSSRTKAPNALVVAGGQHACNAGIAAAVAPGDERERLLQLQHELLLVEAELRSARWVGCCMLGISSTTPRYTACKWFET